MEIFRGGAKTTIARLFMSKRVSYGISHTILFVGPNEKHAAESVSWLMQQVEYNTDWAQAFGLRKGNKWTPTNCDVVHEKFEYPISVLAVGIHGAVRGININDYRPHLIIVHEPCYAEYTATAEQRDKTSRLYQWSVPGTFSPASGEPMGVLLLL